MDAWFSLKFEDTHRGHNTDVRVEAGVLHKLQLLIRYRQQTTSNVDTPDTKHSSGCKVLRVHHNH